MNDHIPRVKMKRIGRFWIDRNLLREGYRLEDIFDVTTPVIELPELFDPLKLKNVGWMICPECGEHAQVDRRNLRCPHCGWEDYPVDDTGELKCAA